MSAGHPSKLARSERGYSLIELLIVVSMTAILMLSLGAAMDAGIRLYSANERRFTSSQGAQTADVLWTKDANTTETASLANSGGCGSSTPLITLTYNDGHVENITWGTQANGSNVDLVRSTCLYVGGVLTTTNRVVLTNIATGTLAAACLPSGSCPGNPTQVTLVVPGGNPGETLTLYGTTQV